MYVCVHECETYVVYIYLLISPNFFEAENFAEPGVHRQSVLAGQ